MAREWRCMIANTSDGTIVSDVALSSYPGFTRKLNDMGSFNVSCRVDAPENASVDFHTYASPKYCWIVAYDSYIAQAGPVWSYHFDDHTRVLSVQGSGIGGMFSRRVTRNSAGTTAIVDASQDLSYSNLSLRAIMGKLVSDNMAQTYGALPITTSNLTETGTNTRTYYGYDLKSLADNMRDLANVDQGPEFEFSPAFTSAQNAVTWSLNVGSPTLGDQASNGVWDYGGSLSTIDVDVNASVSPVSRVWVKGTGSERALLTGYYQDTTQAASGYPLLDYVDGSHTNASVQTTLDGWAKADQVAYSAPFETWKCGVRVDGLLSNDLSGAGVKVSPGLGDFQVGDAPLFYVDGHPWIPTGQYRRRIMGFSSNGPWMINLDLFQTLSFN